MKKYFDKLQFVKSKVTAYLKGIFKAYGDELLLLLKDNYLLTNENYCIEPSTVMGLIVGKFVALKLEIYSKTTIITTK